MSTQRRLRLGIAGLLWFAGIPAVVRAQDEELAKKIGEAIDRGVAYVKAYSDDRGRGAKRPASWALRGWALLEAGVPAGEPAVKKLADYVRQEVPEMDRVYDLSLSIIFLDKLADRGDEPLIESMAVRLMAGQRNKWGWEYAVDKPNMAERTRLARLIQATEDARQKGFDIIAKKRADKEIAQDVARQLRAIDLAAMDSPGDNSNTQFAMIALWVARRHGVPVTQSMEMIERRFQLSQVPTGAWGYTFPTTSPPLDDNHHTYPAMTCAGLLGLALGQGVRSKPRDLSKDFQVQLGLEVLARAMDAPPPRKKPNFHYFLFSLERVAVVYNRQKIGAHDWYLWGARQLVDTQLRDGSWSGGFAFDAADTCFALLFLKRANVAHDLTRILQMPISK
jgi:hypothetical protein